MNNSPINSTINSTTVGELADAISLKLVSNQIDVMICHGLSMYKPHHSFDNLALEKQIRVFTRKR